MNAEIKKKETRFAVGASLLVGLAIISYFLNPAQQNSENGYFVYSQDSNTANEQSDLVKNLPSLLLRYEQSKNDREKATLASLIGQSYYQLQQYPWALIFALRANNLMPRKNEYKQQLASVVDKLGVTIATESFLKPLLLKPFLSKKERQIFLLSFFLLSLLTIFLGFFLQKKRHQMRVMALIFSFFTLYLAAILVYDRFFVAAQAVIVEPALLRLQPNEGAAFLSDKVIAPGEIARVIEISEDGSWLKIENLENAVGYVFYASIRLL